MIRAVKFWNEPNNMSHWDFSIDTKWEMFAEMVKMASQAVRHKAPELIQVLGGLAPIDPQFLQLLKSYGLLQYLDVVAVHGFPLDWNHWMIDEWPEKISEIEAVSDLPVWVTETGASTFGADEIQVFAIRKVSELLLGRVDEVFWYSLLDLPPEWEATTRHKESEGSSYYRHFYMGLIRADGTPKPSMKEFNPEMGMCQWFHFEDHRLDQIVEWLNDLGVRKLRTGINWADWHRPNALEWYDRQMEAIRDFETTVTLCFTPPSRGIEPHHTSPPRNLEEYAAFAEEVVDRYVLNPDPRFQEFAEAGKSANKGERRVR
ncbi:MAG: beta-xylosidase [Calditrichia bacterium]